MAQEGGDDGADQVVLDLGPGVVVAAGSEALQAVEGVHRLAGFLGDLADLEGFELLVGEVGACRSADGGELLDVVPQGVHVGPPIDGFGYSCAGRPS
ncbi:hypothetical protein [Streptomyces sp. NPDC102283]|uniref:hypothetical protein n=1 Tax=Streptomyces sp. NPDC102283 TaxID=3366155 RepID=UPI0037FC96A5